MPAPAFREREMCDDPARIAAFLPLAPDLAALHPSGSPSRFPLVEDPRSTSRAAIIGMMVLRPADSRWMPQIETCALAREIDSIDDWCFDVAGLGGSWPISANDAYDAYRLALQYGSVDAVMAGSSTITREGIDAPGKSGHVWQPYTPLSWPRLRSRRATLEPAIRAVRAAWQELGVLSRRKHPAQIAITESGRVHEGKPDLLDAKIFDARHPDGERVEAWLLTSRAGRQRLVDRARSRGRSIDSQILVASGDDDERIDASRVPLLLREKLDARLVEHDGGARSLGAFVDAGAVAQLQLTLMRTRSVGDVLVASERLDDETRQRVLDGWPSHARLFPLGSGRLPARWKAVHGVADDAEGAEAVAVTFAL